MNVKNESFCSDENIPLSVTKASYQHIPKSELLKKTKERCEICDKVFYNKYSMLLHNTKHIIIPLLRQRIYQCMDCSKLFISTAALKRHTINDHLRITNGNDYVPELIESFIKTEPYTFVNKTELGVKEEKDIAVDNEGILQLLVSRQPITLLTKEPFLCNNRKDDNEELLQCFVKKESVVLEPLIFNLDDISNDCSTSNSCYELEDKIQDKILFESDSDEGDIIQFSNGLMTDTTVDCNNGDNGVIKPNSVIISQIPNEEWVSVHYDELKKPGVYKCKKCSHSFPDRYTLIKHEKIHITFKLRLGFLCRICDWYLPNNRWCYQRHMESKHPNRILNKTKTIYKCRRCGLKYRHKSRHYENYHPDVQRKRNRGKLSLKHPLQSDAANESECSKVKNPSDRKCSEQEQPVNGGCAKEVTLQAKSKWLMVKVCDVCFMLVLKRTCHRYRVLGMHKGADLCDLCCKPHSELRLVNCKRSFKIQRCKTKKKTPHSLTNTERLQKVQKRLKFMKYLNKH